jgi:hypothetical protein
MSERVDRRLAGGRSEETGLMNGTSGQLDTDLKEWIQPRVRGRESLRRPVASLGGRLEAVNPTLSRLRRLDEPVPDSERFDARKGTMDGLSKEPASRRKTLQVTGIGRGDRSWPDTCLSEGMGSIR